MNTFFGEIFTKKFAIECIQNIIKTLLYTAVITFSAFMLNKIWVYHKEVSKENNIIKSLSLGESKEYIESLIDKPRFEFIENNLNNSFYPLNHIIVRCVFNENDMLIGYFITAKELNSDIKFFAHLSFDIEYQFGKETIDSSSNATNKINLEIYSNTGNGSGAISRLFYWECNQLDGTGDYKDFIVSIVPYGFIEEGSYVFVSNAMGNNNDFKIIGNDRKKIHPNTYGIMDSEYRGLINPYIEDVNVSALWVDCVYNLMNESE